MKTNSSLKDQAGIRNELPKAALLLVAAVILNLIAPAAMGFDGRRKGFVIGEGLGVAPVTKFSGTYGHESNIGVGFNSLIGYGWSERDILAFEANFGYRHSDLFTKKARDEEWTDWDGIPFGDQSILQGFAGLSWYHYYGKLGKSLFTAIGIGRYVFIPGSFGGNEASLGWMIGGGYGFHRHLQAGIYLSSGKTSDYFNQFKHLQFSVLLTAIQF